MAFGSYWIYIENILISRSISYQFEKEVGMQTMRAPSHLWRKTYV